MEAGIEADFPVSVVSSPAGAGTEPRWHGMLIWMGIKKRRAREGGAGKGSSARQLHAARALTGEPGNPQLEASHG
jgi:hypothetical protein